MTKKWDRPTLVVLGRGTPEERVLEICKGHDAANATPDPGLPTACFQQGANAHPCRGVTGS